MKYVAGAVVGLLLLSIYCVIQREPRGYWCSMREDRQHAREHCERLETCKLTVSDLTSMAEYERYCTLSEIRNHE